MSDLAKNQKRNADRGTPWLWLLISLAGILLDQVSKWLCMVYLKAAGSVTIIPGLLKLTYLENRGAAFGSFSDQRWVFMIFSTVAIVGVTVYLLAFSERNRLLRWALALIISGGIGNMIDRVSLGYVIDMIDFYAIWPYIFNVADSFVCVGAGMVVLYCILEMQKELKHHREEKEATACDSDDAEQASDDDATEAKGEDEV